MSAAEFAGLSALVQRLRKQLWRRRIRRAVACGMALGGLFLLLAGVVHLAVLAVPATVWLPLALAPVLSGAAFALLWQRPGSATAVAAFDRHQRHGELFVSALEAYNTPQRERSAGAACVLRAAAARVPALVVPADWATQQQRFRWPPAYTATVWVLVVAGLFLLQLPPQATLAAPGMSVAPGAARVTATQALVSARESGTARGAWVPGVDGAGIEKNALLTTVPPGAPAPRQDAPLRAVPIQQAPPGRTTDTAANTVTDASGAGPVMSPGGERGDDGVDTTAGSAPGAASGNNSEHGAGGTPQEPFDLPLRYVDVARQIAAQVQQTIAGEGGVAFTASDRAYTPGATAPAAQFELQLPGLPYSTRFSPSQRAQINTYFNAIETLP